MRESNFAFPAQNRACVCITSQLYDRRALDTTSPLPLFNSLTHLTYLTSTSPRIREIMTMDGGLERLVRILHDFCMCPPPPDNPAILYGLAPPNSRPPKLIPTLNPPSFDKHAAYRFSLAFQCVVNIGVRGSEPIRSRVVQAGTLDVVGCILEAWLANKGFAVGPSSSATGMPRETREQRQARRQAQAELRQREVSIELERALRLQIQGDQMLHLERGTTAIEIHDDTMDASITSNEQTVSIPGPSNSNSDTDIDTSTEATPIGSNTPTGSVLVTSRDRSGTIIARPVWDEPPATVARHRTLRPRASPSTDTSRPDTETEDDGDGDVEMDGTDRNEIDELSPSPDRRPRHLSHRRAVGIVSDEPPAPTLQVNTDAHIIINDAQDGAVGEDGGVGVEDGIISMEPNDDFAMGAPPGAPGAIDEGTTPRGINVNRMDDRRRGNGIAPDVTPRAGLVNLPMVSPTIDDTNLPRGEAATQRNRNTTQRGRATPGEPLVTATTANASVNLGGRTSSSHSHHHRDTDSGPYRDEDVLLSLQLLAYLSKYPHVRQAFYKPRNTFHPASANLPGARYGVGSSTFKTAVATASSSAIVPAASPPVKESHPFFRAFASASARGKEKEKATSPLSNLPGCSSSSSIPASSSAAALNVSPPRQTNVFSLVERFTFRPSSTETDLPNPPPKLPPEIQYWAGVIMRNACRKDESRGGIRQCANMLCGRWESYPREFAKCRRCRKAKYCGKECQSTAWSEGHRFWCSAKDADEEAMADPSHTHNTASGSGVEGAPVTVAGGDEVGGVAGIGAAAAVTMTAGGTITGRTERRAERERERHARERTLLNLAGEMPRVARPLTMVPNVQGTATAANPTAGGSTTARAGVPHVRDRERTVVPSQPESYDHSRRRFAQLQRHVLDDTPRHDMNSRSRAETVPGAGNGETAAPQQPTRRLTDRYFSHASVSTASTAAAGTTEAGPSRRRPPAGDHDMVIG